MKLLKGEKIKTKTNLRFHNSQSSFWHVVKTRKNKRKGVAAAVALKRRKKGRQ
jgi:hypothetical protein